MILHVVGFSCHSSTDDIWYLSNHTSAETIFTTFRNDGKRPMQGLAFMTVLNSTVLDFLASDSVIHMAGETQELSQRLAKEHNHLYHLELSRPLWA